MIQCVYIIDRSEIRKKDASINLDETTLFTYSSRVLNPFLKRVNLKMAENKMVPTIVTFGVSGVRNNVDVIL